MRKWRVGTLSLGVLLIALGVIILIAQVNQYRILDTMLTWWPIVLILIGGEILWQIYTSKDQDPRVRYDVFSMFIILVVVSFSIGMYALTSTGVLEMVTRAVSSRNMTLEIPRSSFEVDNSIEEIIIKAPRESLNLEVSAGKNLVMFGTATLDAVDEKEAEGIIEQGKMSVNREGEKLYVSIVPMPRSGDMKPGVYDVRYTLLLPKGKKIRIESTGYYDIKVAPDAIEGSWLVDGRGRISIKMAKDANVSVEAQVPDPNQLGGSAVWQASENPSDNFNGQTWFKGSVQWGDGRHRIIILNGDEVLIDEI